MALPATDNFNRADANPIGGNWTTAPGFSALRIVSNQVTGTPSEWSAAYWNADTFNNDQYSQATIGAGSDIGNPAVRIKTSGSSKNCYFVKTNVGSTLFRLYKQVNDTNTFIVDLYSGGANNIATDIVKLEVIGTTLNVYRNGILVGTVSDSSLATGASGLISWGNTHSLDDWEGGDIAGGGGGQLIDGGLLSGRLIDGGLIR